jgi:hypothetical protein
MILPVARDKGNGAHTGFIAQNSRDGRKLPAPLGSLLASVSAFSLPGLWRDELAGGEVIEGAEAAAQLDVAQAAVAVERAYKLDGVALGLQ